MGRISGGEMWGEIFVGEIFLPGEIQCYGEGSPLSSNWGFGIFICGFGREESSFPCSCVGNTKLDQGNWVFRGFPPSTLVEGGKSRRVSLILYLHTRW